ncbi:hypothetical protein IE81DRAFT_348870 [Ceraceosorus guamensis]|uniref:Uncharacterized protein n=1 Tax=Ceraceosorus guamensis TaxID=1522189 RepID=A0A316VUD9_9BASI|nr:hypothetical protein IE81DRAFT_348870 [Ceraceosorus guamensis]PWN40854.1 hypothetical protein IE81DRAFT_348870 [Ceraceosorus guamensis]
MTKDSKRHLVAEEGWATAQEELMKERALCLDVASCNKDLSIKLQLTEEKLLIQEGTAQDANIKQESLQRHLNEAVGSSRPVQPHKRTLSSLGSGALREKDFIEQIRKLTAQLDEERRHSQKRKIACTT